MRQILNLDDQVYAYMAGVSRTGLSDNNAINTGTYFQKTQAIAFETGSNVSRLQMLYEQGGELRGLNLYIDNGKLYAGLWNKAEENWGHKELDVNINANTKYTATLVMDGKLPANGTAKLYLNGDLVDTVGGVGRLYSHGDDIGIGEVAGTTLVHNSPVSQASEFNGNIESLVQYNNALSGSDLAQLDAALVDSLSSVSSATAQQVNVGEVKLDQGSSIDLPDAPRQTGGNQVDGGNVKDTNITGGTINVTGGRVTTLDPPQNNIADIKIISGVNHGNVTVNPDNTLALVMTQSNFTGKQAFTYEVTYKNGSKSTHKVNLNVTKGSQKDGWGTGEDQYILATDANDKVIAEAGDKHTKVFVSGAKDALSFADIAKLEGIPTSRVNGKWLANQNKYGQSEEFALDATAGKAMWNAVTPAGSSNSNHLLFERGHDYRGFSNLVNKGVSGETEINPILIGAYGNGDKPTMLDGFGRAGSNLNIENVVFQDVHFSKGMNIWSGKNILLDNVTFEGRSAGGGSKANFSDVEGLTFHNSELYDIWRTEAKTPNGPQAQSWHDRTHGIYVQGSEGILLEGNFFDQIGWNPNYNSNNLWSGGQSPSMWSHNVYIQYNNEDVTVRDNISSRSASIGLMVRSGGVIENNVLLDNNIGISTTGGDYKGAGPVGSYSLIADNVVTSAGARAATNVGATTWGIQDNGKDTSSVDNIVTHLADPNSNEINQKRSGARGGTLAERDSAPDFYNDTIVYNWTTNSGATQSGKNLSNLNRNALDETTIQRFAQQLLDKPNAGIEDLAEYIKANSDGQLDTSIDADIINQYFQTGFNIAPDVRGGSTTLRFVPDELGDGVRWDNKLNWSTDDLPGLYTGDDVDLGGNHVVFGGNAIIDTLDLSKGDLTVYGGRLIVTGGIVGDGGTITVEGAGQLYIDGNSGSLVTVNVTGGRFVNTGTGAGLRVNNRGGDVVNNKNLDLIDEFVPDHVASGQSSSNNPVNSTPSAPAPEPEPLPVKAYEYTNGVNQSKLVNSEAINTGKYLAKTQGVAFETGGDVNSLQVVYEQGGSIRGLNLFIESGKLYAAVWNKAEENWGYKELSVDITADTKYTATLVMDGALPANGKAELYLNGDLVDTVSGVGQLYGHADDIGIGRVADETLVHNLTVNKASGFGGTIESLVQYNAALSGDNLTQLNEALTEGHVVQAQTSAVQDMVTIADLTEEEVPALSDVDQAYAFRGGVSENGLQDNTAINTSKSLQKTQGVAFETGGDVNSLQVVYEQGGSIRGLNLFIESGKLYAAVWNKAEENWGYKELSVDITADTKYTATLVMDGALPANGKAELYLNGDLVDTVSGVGQLYGHADDIGIGEVAGSTLVHNSTVKQPTEFKGNIESLVQYNDALSDYDLPQLHDALSYSWSVKESAASMMDAFNTAASDEFVIDLDNADVLNGSGSGEVLVGLQGDDTISGNDGDDVIFGGSGNDSLRGGSGNDTIVLGDGKDQAWGGSGSDSFVFESFDADVDTIFGFEAGQGGDVLNLTDVLKDFDPLMDDILSFVQISENNGNSEIQVNTGAEFKTVAIIEGGLSNMTVNDLVQSGNLVLDQAI